MKTIRQIMCWHNWRWESTDEMDRNRTYVRAPRCKKCGQWRNNSFLNDLLVVLVWGAMFAVVAKASWMLIT